jgi:hypothetical protein
MPANEGGEPLASPRFSDHEEERGAMQGASHWLRDRAE